MATITDTTTDANGNIIINVSSSAEDAITLATAGTYSDKNIIFNIKTPQSTVQPDWNQNDSTAPDYVKNRPFYTGDPVKTALVEEITVPFSDFGDGLYMGQIESTFLVTVGEIYKVSWDGSTYECTCVDIEGTLAFGNLSIAGAGSDTGEPFLIVYDSEGVFAAATADTSASHTISISSIVSPVVKIDRKYLPIPFKHKGESFLTFSSLSSFTLAVNDATKHWNGTLEYFTSDRTWATWDGTTILSAVADDGEYVLCLRGTGNTIITGFNDNYRWILTGSNIACIGNIENLLDYATVKSGMHPTLASNCYQYMFSKCTSLTQAPALPATTLTEWCYSDMFQGCTNLTQAPALPATTLASNCYSNMFQGCTNLTQAPALPATTLASGCYQHMFDSCTSLTQAPALPATTLTGWCYEFMFSKCTSLTQAPALPATTLATGCYFNMFQGCTNLTQAPALPATTLATGCYFNMFQGCTNLTQAPALPATTLASNCYQHMFDSCTSLTQAPALPATTLTGWCYEFMFYGCTSLKLSSTKTNEYMQEYRIPSSENGVTATNALNRMFFSTGGTFTGTPSINTTYYLSSNNMIVRETDIATLNGYVGSMINNAIPMPDTTLSITGKSADAKVTGDAIRALSKEIADLPQPDWNQNDDTQPDYVKNRPFYTGDPVETVLVEENTVPFEDEGDIYMAQFMSTFEATVGETYTVTWDGGAYECTCTANDNGPISIGNTSIAGFGSDTGEPFVMFVVDYPEIMIGTLDTSASHTFSISGIVAPIVKIPAKYIDKNSSGYITIHSNDTMTEQEAENYRSALFKGEVVFIIWDNLCINDISFSNGTDSTGTSFFDLILHTQNNEVYRIARNSEGFFVLNDRRLWSAQIPGNTRIGDVTSFIEIENNIIKISPRAFHVGVGSTDVLFEVKPDGTKSKSFEVLRNGEAVTPALILYSSTAGSTKKFRITVDDSGKPTFTNSSNSTDSYTPTDLPPVTSSDSGKFLRVSSAGEWVAETIPNASGVSF